MVYEQGSKRLVLGMVIQPLIGNPYNGYINPYYWVDDHPLLYGNNGSLDPSTYRCQQCKLTQLWFIPGWSSQHDQPNLQILLFFIIFFGAWRSFLSPRHRRLAKSTKQRRWYNPPIRERSWQPSCHHRFPHRETTKFTNCFFSPEKMVWRKNRCGKHLLDGRYLTI